MLKILRKSRSITVLVCLFILSSAVSFVAPKEKDVLAAMKKAAGFMANTVSNHGGYVYTYTEAMSNQWGEIPARKTQIWTQPPGTPAVGKMYLDVYKVTGDPDYLDYAKRAADALIRGQHSAGGWHYLIDFDMPGIRKYYDEVATKCYGWEEYYHYYGNCTFDDDASSAPTKLLLDIYMTTLDPKYKAPLIKALIFFLESQYPNGGWPQRYPLMYDFPHHGLPDYTHYYTFNDGIILNNIDLLLEAYKKLGNEEYLMAAVRGMDFVKLSQLPPPQAGWGQQYDMDLNSVAARSFEPASVMAIYTNWNVRALMKFYTITGDRRYLSGIPDAIEWLENSYLPEGHAPNDRYTHAMFNELGTNKPLYAHKEGDSRENDHTWIDHNPENIMTGYGMWTTIDVEGLKKEYARLSLLSPEQARTEYKAKKDTPSPVPEVDVEKVEKIISSMDNRGAWVEEISLPDFSNPWKGPRTTFRGISIRTFLDNMHTLINYLENLNNR